MKQINTVDELEQYFLENNSLITAVNNTTERLLVKLNEIIEETVYSYKPTWDGRTGQFKKSWERESAKIVGGMINREVTSKIYQNFDTMVYDGSKWKHGNPWESLAKNQLNNIIEYGLPESHFNFPAIEERPFWSKFLEYVNKNLDEIFQEECAKVGLDIKPTISSYTG